MATRLPFTVAQLVAKLRSQDGVTESPMGSNIQPYSKALGRGPEPWCADFLGWGMLTLGWDIRPVIPGFAWTPTMFAQMGSVLGWERVAFDQLRAGDVLFWSFSRNGVIEHVELATGAAAAGVVPAIGGNTAAPGLTRSQSNGGMVAENRRVRADFYGARRPLFAVPTDPTQEDPMAGITDYELATGVWNGRQWGEWIDDNGNGVRDPLTPIQILLMTHRAAVLASRPNVDALAAAVAAKLPAGATAENIAAELIKQLSAAPAQP